MFCAVKQRHSSAQRESWRKIGFPVSSSVSATRRGRSGVEWTRGLQWRRRSVWSAQTTGPPGAKAAAV